MARRAFVFSLDAFVAFSLILISIQSLLVISSAPKGYYPALLQADHLASDTMQVLTLAESSPGQTYLDMDSQRISEGAPPTHMIAATNRLIPRPYSYAYYFYNFSNKKWTLLFNASDQNVNIYDPNNIHINVTYKRVQASAQALVLGYDYQMVPGASPYCNVACKGWDPTRYNSPGGSDYSFEDRAKCTKVPCDVKNSSSFQAGDFNVGILRLVVWG